MTVAYVNLSRRDPTTPSVFYVKCNVAQEAIELERAIEVAHPDADVIDALDYALLAHGD